MTEAEGKLLYNLQQKQKYEDMLKQYGDRKKLSKEDKIEYDLTLDSWRLYANDSAYYLRKCAEELPARAGKTHSTVFVPDDNDTYFYNWKKL